MTAAMSNESDGGLDRTDIESEKVTNLGAEGLIRLFTMRLSTYVRRHNYSRERCIGEVAIEFRDDYKVNILRVIDECEYVHPDGYHWNIGPFSEGTMRKFDPVFPEALEEGGSADFQVGDVLKLDGYPLLIIGANDTHVIGQNAAGKIASHPIPAIRELFNSEEYSPRLLRDGEVVRGVDDAE